MGYLVYLAPKQGEMTMSDPKAVARTAAFARRKAAFAAGQGQAAELLADVLSAHAGKVLAGYMPMRTEIDPLPAMAAHQGLVGVPDKDVADGELFGLDGDIFFTGQLNQFVFANVDGDGGCD